MMQPPARLTRPRSRAIPGLPWGFALFVLCSGSLAWDASSGRAPSVPGRLGIGVPATPAEIQARDIDVMPDGEGLPEGSGSVAAGRQVYEDHCLACHGPDGQGGSAAALAGSGSVDPAIMAADRSITHTIGNYWPWATTLFDYTRRAMPFDRPGSLSNEQVYAVTAYLLFLNELLTSDARLDADTLPAIRMPARRFFRPDERSGVPAP